MHRIAIMIVAAASTAHAGFGPFTEDFDTDAANWFNSNGASDVDWSATGGPDGGAYATQSLFVSDPPPPFGVTAFRGHDEYDSSDDAFVGDWTSAGITGFSFWIRHDGAAPLDVFARFATSFNFPGAAGISFAPVLPNVWTEVFIDVTEGSPQLVLEDTYDGVFSNVGNVQVGFSPSAPHLGQSITIDIDKVSTVPTPAAWALLAPAFALRRRRRR